MEQAAHEWDLIAACHNLMKLHTLQTKVRLVAHIIFTEFKGIPTGNQIHDLIGKGSLSTITDELRHFWRALQHRSSESLAIEHIPQAVTDSFKECLPTLWANTP